LAHPDAHRVLKALIASANEYTNRAQEIVSTALERLSELLAKNILAVLRHRSVYILIAMIENTSYKEFVIIFFSNKTIN
jgi:hypothetical protein